MKKQLYMMVLHLLWATGILRPFVHAIFYMVGIHWIEAKVAANRAMFKHTPVDVVEAWVKAYESQWNMLANQILEDVIEGKEINL